MAAKFTLNKLLPSSYPRTERRRRLETKKKRKQTEQRAFKTVGKHRKLYVQQIITICQRVCVCSPVANLG